jgi:hypothetical protein
VKFDVVFWNRPEGNLMHFELITSPEVPQTSGINMSQLYSYFPGMVSHCVSFLTGVGVDERNKILITECNDVINFAFEKPAATPSADQANEPAGTPDLTAPPSTL